MSSMIWSGGLAQQVIPVVSHVDFSSSTNIYKGLDFDINGQLNTKVIPITFSAVMAEYSFEEGQTYYSNGCYIYNEEGEVVSDPILQDSNARVYCSEYGSLQDNKVRFIRDQDELSLIFGEVMPFCSDTNYKSIKSIAYDGEDFYNPAKAVVEGPLLDFDLSKEHKEELLLYTLDIDLQLHVYAFMIDEFIKLNQIDLTKFGLKYHKDLNLLVGQRKLIIHGHKTGIFVFDKNSENEVSFSGLIPFSSSKFESRTVYLDSMETFVLWSNETDTIIHPVSYNMYALHKTDLSTVGSSTFSDRIVTLIGDFNSHHCYAIDQNNWLLFNKNMDQYLLHVFRGQNGHNMDAQFLQLDEYVLPAMKYPCIDLLKSNTINHSFSEDCMVFPNPAYDYLYIRNAPNDTRVLIYDGLGRLVHAEEKDVLTIDHLSPGHYTVRLLSERYGDIKNMKFLKI